MTNNNAQSKPAWSVRLAPYRRPSNARATVELFVTVGLFFATWALACFVLKQWGVWQGLLFTIPAGGFLVRVFILQHDCGHGSLFTTNSANRRIGRLLGVLTFTPYDTWRDSHARHHAGSGNLHERGFGDIDLMTVEEYKSATAWRKVRYRLYRHPVILFGLGPAYMFLLRHRMPLGKKNDSTVWTNTMLTNAGIAGLSLLMMLWVGVGSYLWIQIPTVVIGASVGGQNR